MRGHFLETGRGIESIKRLAVGPPGLSGLLFVTLFAAVILQSATSGALNPLRDADSAWLIKTGEWILAHGTLPSHNPFGNPYPELSAIPIVCYQWLFELLLGVTYRWLDLQGVVLLVALLFGLTCVTLVQWLYQRGLRGAAVLLPLCVTLTAAVQFAMARPMLVSLLLTAILMRLLHKPLSSRSAWLIFPLFFLLWANLHLGFIAGLAIFAAYQLEQIARTGSWRPVLLWLLCAGCTLVNPYGPELYAHFWRLAVASPFMSANIVELQSPSSSAFGAYLAVAALAGVLAFRDARIGTAEKLLFAASLIAAVWSSRHVYLLTVFSLPFLAVCVERWTSSRPLFAGFDREFSQERERPGLWIAGAILLGLLLAERKAYPATFPQAAPLAGAVQYLNQNRPPTPILTSVQWGSYLIFASSARGYLDSRMDMYGDDEVRELVTAYAPSGVSESVWQERAIRYALYPFGTLAPRYLEKALGWQVLYHDSQAVLLTAPVD